MVWKKLEGANNPWKPIMAWTDMKTAKYHMEIEKEYDMYHNSEFKVTKEMVKDEQI